METTGQRLKTLRTARKMKQIELADELHISKFTVSAWERDLRRPSPALLEELSSVFQVTPAYLRGDDKQ